MSDVSLQPAIIGDTKLVIIWSINKERLLRSRRLNPIPVRHFLKQKEESCGLPGVDKSDK